ncbi:MAG: hypothetical protein AB8F94_17245 [Saprospiraceae bacterium]
MKWEQFRNRFRKGARQQEVDVNMDALWEALEPQVDELNKEEPRRRRFVFWILFAGTLAIGASWLLVSNGNKQDVIVEEQLGETNPISNQEDENSANLNSIFELEKEDDQSLNKNEIDVNLKLNNTITNQSNNLKKENTPSFSNEKSKNDRERLEIEKDLTSTNLKLDQTQINQSQKSTTTSTTPELSLLKNKASNSSKGLDLEVNSNGGLKETTTISVLPEKIPGSNNQEDNQKEFLRLPHLPLFLSLKEVAIVNLEDLFSMTSEEKNIDENKSNDSKDDSSEGTPPGNKTDSDFKFWAGIDGGASFINRSLSAKDGSVSVLLQNRTQYESPLETSHYGISIGVDYKNKFRFSTGIQQTIISERFDFNETLTAVDSILGVQILRLNFAGDTIPIMGNIPRTTTTKNQLKVYNTYKLIDIPVTIGYHHTFKDKWKVGVQAGVLVNLSLKTKGGIPDEMLQEVNIETNQSNIFKSKVGLNYHFGLSIGRSFFDKVELNFSPTVRFYQNDFSVQNYGLSQKYMLIGGNLGLRYKF